MIVPNLKNPANWQHIFFFIKNTQQYQEVYGTDVSVSVWLKKIRLHIVIQFERKLDFCTAMALC